ncbi:MAG: YceD family protein, partial [Polyangia bacterium]
MLVQTELPRALFADALEGMDADVDGATGNIRVELSKDRDDNVFARGDVKALFHVPCALCLAPSLVKISAPLKMTFVPGGGEDESGDPLDDVEVTGHDGLEIDLGAIVREQIILGVPMS